MPDFKWTLHQQDPHSHARLGSIQTAHGVISTPAFMPVGTKATVKTLTTRQLEELDAHVILGNTYHLMLRPGMDTIEKAGGLHAFMGWNRPILTDSGGFQVFSLSSLNKITEEGVYFQSHIDGARLFLGPDESMCIQKTLGSDIVMAFDECSPSSSTRIEVEEAMHRTHRWAKKCKEYSLKEHQNLFAIVQGGMHEDLRIESARTLRELDCEGYAIGGLSVGEPAEVMYAMLDATVPFLPEDKPRYLMGVGTPRNLIEAVMRGIDTFDCVMPTRNARNGTAFTWSGKLSIKAAKYAQDFTPLDPELLTEASCTSKAYIRHLLSVHEITGMTLVSLQNIAFYLDFMRRIRQAIRYGVLNEFYKTVCQIYPS